jgi:hypothetical protein
MQHGDGAMIKKSVASDRIIKRTRAFKAEHC